MDKETQYEKFLGVKTNEEVIIPGNTRKLKYSLYEASEYEGLEQIFDGNISKKVQYLWCILPKSCFYSN